VRAQLQRREPGDPGWSLRVPRPGREGPPAAQRRDGRGERGELGCVRWQRLGFAPEIPALRSPSRGFSAGNRHSRTGRWAGAARAWVPDLDMGVHPWALSSFQFASVYLWEGSRGWRRLLSTNFGADRGVFWGGCPSYTKAQLSCRGSGGVRAGEGRWVGHLWSGARGAGASIGASSDVTALLACLCFVFFFVFGRAFGVFADAEQCVPRKQKEYYGI